MRRLWYLLVFIITMAGRLAGVWPRATSLTHPIRCRGSSYPFCSAATGYRPACAWALGTTFQVTR
jgi:hypothetical protein